MKPNQTAQPEENLVRSLDSQPLESVNLNTLKRPSMTKPNNKFLRVLLKVLAVVLVLVIIVGIGLYFSLYLPARQVYTSIQKLEASGRAVAPYIKNQDLVGTKQQLEVVKQDLDKTKSDFEKLSWLKVVPVARNYYNDGTHGLVAADEMIKATNVTITAIEPYADVIGLKGISGGGDGGKTAEDRITFIVNTLDKIKPQLSEIGAHIESARKEVDQIDPNRYPEEFRGMRIREQLTTGITVLDQASSLVNDAQPLLESAPYILGLDSARTYLVLFHNDAELRPTGGFMTGYAIITVHKGKISTVLSDDIYKLDEKFAQVKKIPAPEPIKKYHPNVPYFYLRDQNLSPDFKASMETFMPNYQLTKSPKVDGVIAVNTKVLVDLLKVTGPIGVPGYGNFSANDDPRCNCPQVFYELQVLAGGEEPVVWDSVSGKIVKAPANYGNRKGFLGPIMYSILANTMAQPKTKFPELFKAAIGAIEGKHAMLYFYDPKIQSAVESFNMAGRLHDTESDYLMVVDTNFSGGKTNIWVKYDADIKTEISGDGTVTKTLNLKYTNPQPGSVKIESGRNLNGQFRDWLRVYVPKGSKLVEAKGFELGQATGEDLNKTVFEGFFTLTPQNVKNITIKYELPFKIKSPYKVLIQKQPGTKDFIYNQTVNNRKQPELVLSKDTELVISY